MKSFSPPFNYQYMSKSYSSASLGRDVLLTDMEDHHLNNTITKLTRERDAGMPYPTEVLRDLQAEQARRRNGSLATSGITQQAAQPEPQASPASPTLVDATCSLLKAVINDLGERKPLFDAVGFDLKFNDLMSNVVSFVNSNTPSGIKALAASGPPITPVAAPARGPIGGTRLADLPSIYPSLRTPLLVNSLRNYGVVTVSDLSALSRADFAAVRYSTTPAFLDARRLFQDTVLNWNNVSTVLLRDGDINRTLNPNVSPIETFVREAELRLTNTQSISAVGRVMDGVKRRISLAAQVAGTLILASGYTSTAAAEAAVLRIPHRSLTFKQQVLTFLQRTVTRVASVNRAGDALPVLGA